MLAIVDALPHLDGAHAVATADGVAASKRFGMVRMFLSDTDRARVQVRPPLVYLGEGLC